MGFGYLPKPLFPTQLNEDRPQEIVLDTVGKQLPSFGTQIPVYFIPSARPSLLALDSAKEKAASLGFVFAPEKVSNDMYRWRRTLPLPANLEMNIVTSTFTAKVDWASSVTLLTKRMLPNADQATAEMRTILRSAQMLTDDVATATPQITYIKALAGEMKPVSSLSEADFIRLDLYRVAPHNIPTVTVEKDHGVIRLLLSGSRDQGERVLEFTSSYLPVEWQTFHTYPLQSTAMAFSALQAGEGYIVSRPPGSKAVVRNVVLAYFEPISPQNYYQPVYVFDGDDGFRAVVPALDPRIFTSGER